MDVPLTFRTHLHNQAHPSVDATSIGPERNTLPCDALLEGRLDWLALSTVCDTELYMYQDTLLESWYETDSHTNNPRVVTAVRL